MTKAEQLANITKPILRAKQIGNNTLCIEYADGSTAIRLHSTDVVTSMANGDIILDSGGWQTAVTKSRINEFSPYTVTEIDQVWYVNEQPFYDGMCVLSTQYSYSEIGDY